MVIIRPHLRGRRLIVHETSGKVWNEHHIPATRELIRSVCGIQGNFLVHWFVPHVEAARLFGLTVVGCQRCEQILGQTVLKKD